MKRLSNGADSTLGSYRDLCVTIFGAYSIPALFFEQKIKTSPNGEAEEVIADETQMMFFILKLLNSNIVIDNGSDQSSKSNRPA